MNMLWRRNTSFRAPAAGVLLAAALAAGAWAEEKKVEVTPPAATVLAGQSAAFTANEKVKWSLSADIGTISEDGQYTAPRVAPCEDDRVIVIATSEADAKRKGSATVTVTGSADGRFDCREDFEAALYLGVGVDTFAASELSGYLNPQAATSSKERGVGGFNFGYRLVGSPATAAKLGKGWLRTTQLWVYGETVHGVRSSDVDCAKHRDFPTCADYLGLSAFKNRTPENLFYIIRNATSIEGFTGLRWEFLTLQDGGKSPANLYLKGQLGFLKVSGSPDDAVDMHHVGLGAIATKGGFQGSYLEAGFGRSDLYGIKSRDRWKFDGYLSRQLGESGVSFFTQIVVDSDFGKGSDSVQTYFGLEFDLRKFRFGW
jgi:hypothetical protein